jgi:hypothetical protein
MILVVYQDPAQCKRVTVMVSGELIIEDVNVADYIE